MTKSLYSLGSALLKWSRKNFRPINLDSYLTAYPTESLSEKRFYNIGAGDFHHPFWTNVDGGNDYRVNWKGKVSGTIEHDLFDHQPLPVPDNSAELVYTSHTIEHVDDKSVEFLLADCFRMLKPGGTIRIVTPDIDLSYQAWRRKDRSFFYWIGDEYVNKNLEKQCLNTPLLIASTAQIWLEEFAAGASQITTVGGPKRLSDQDLEELFTKMPYENALNYCTSLCSVEQQKLYPFRHMNWFNANKMHRMLSHAGFKTVRKSAYLQSYIPVMRNSGFFDYTQPQLSLYMEAEK
jgi:predicted SAM-dependent methyltransferase